MIVLKAEKYTVVKIYKCNLCDECVYNSLSGEHLTKCNDMSIIYK